MLQTLKVLSVGIPLLSVGVVFYQQNGAKNFTYVTHANEKEMTLQQVQVVFRHGARTPSIDFPTPDIPNVKEFVWDVNTLIDAIPEVDINYTVKLDNGKEPPESEIDQIYVDRGKLKGGCYPGQLTLVGLNDMHKVGEWLAKEYIYKHKLISPIYTPDEIYIRSSNIKRTLSSVVALISGLYGKESIKEPVSIFTKSAFNEDLYPNRGYCNNMKKWSGYVWENFDLLPGHKEDYVKIDKLVGGSERIDFVGLNDCIKCRRAHGMSVPNHLLEHEELIARRATQLMIYLLTGKNNSKLSYAIGSFVDTLCCRITESINKEKSTKKLLLYSAHDTTLMTILKVFDLWDEKWPPVSSHISIELYRKKDDRYFIRILYNGEVRSLDKDNGDEFYPVEKFMKLVETYRVKDWALNCGNDK